MLGDCILFRGLGQLPSSIIRQVMTGPSLSHYGDFAVLKWLNGFNTRQKPKRPSTSTPYILKQKQYHRWITTVRSSRSPVLEMYITIYTRGGQTCSMYEPHIVNPKLQRTATLKSKNTYLFAIYASVTS